jgi:protoheme IX farnesyltransferase
MLIGTANVSDPLATPSTRAQAAPAAWRCYFELTKPKVVTLITFTAMVGTLLASGAVPSLATLAWASTGIALAAASAATLNHVLERQIDAQMARTRARPLPAGRVSRRRAMILAATLGALAMGILVALVNVATAVLTFVSLIAYAGLYTLWLKHATPQNIVIGGVAGAMPPVLGWTAITGHVDANALLLFLIIFVWTPPHFWALAIARGAEYERAGVPMLPVTHGVAHTRLQILLYTILLTVVTLLPFLTGMSGCLYLGAALTLDAGFLYHAVALKRSSRPQLPMRVFRFSVSYLMWLFAALLIDHYLPTLRAA